MREENARALIAAVLVVALTVGGPIEAAYLQMGVDAARTGNSQDIGPLREEVAWRIKIPGSRAIGSQPVIIGNHVFVATHNGSDYYRHTGPYATGLDFNGVLRIDVDLAEPEPFAALESGVNGFASDGERLYVATFFHGIQTLRLHDGAVAWRWSYPQASPDKTNFSTRCEQLAVLSGVLYAGCTQMHSVAFTAPKSPVTFAVGLDAGTGKELWISYKGFGKDGFETGAVTDVHKRGTPTVNAPPVEFTGLTVLPPHLVMVTREGELDPTPQWGRFVWAVKLSDGRQVWMRDVLTPQAAEGDPMGNFPFDVPPSLPPATGKSGLVITRLNDTVAALNPATGEDLWSFMVGREDALKQDAGGGFAFDGESLFTASAQTLYKTNTTTRTTIVVRTLATDTVERWSYPGFVLARGILYGASEKQAGGTTYVVRAIDPLSGNQFFAHEVRDQLPDPGLGAIHFAFGVGEGVMAVAGIDGSVTLMGRTGASIKPVLNVSSLYPVPGVRVSVTLDETFPGSQGRATDFRVVWGDGKSTDWQESPRFNHAYERPGNYTATFWAANPFGQRSAEDVVFHVGGTDPALAQTEEKATIVTAEETSSLDFRLFLVGLALTAGGGILGALALRSKRNRLKLELRALQETFDKTKTEPLRCEGALAARRRHIQGLLESGKLSESQFEVLMRRADDLTHEARLSGLDDRFAFLPHGLVRMLQRMLEDRRVSPMERESFFAALDREKSLTPEQRERARRLVEEWFTRDSGARPSPHP